MTPHPAKFSVPILDAISRWIDPCWRILDPFAGVGGVHKLDADTLGIELEYEWASQHPRTVCADALILLPWLDLFEGIVTSPCYGNRMADHHNATDNSKRMTYRHQLGRPLSPNNSGGMQWGRTYREFHTLLWALAVARLAPDGLFILNCADHIRRGECQYVTAWHCNVLQELGLSVECQTTIETQRMGFGANAQLRCPEQLCVLRKRL